MDVSLRIIIVAALLSQVVACGMKGDLFLPEPASEAVAPPASTGETPTESSDDEPTKEEQSAGPTE